MKNKIYYLGPEGSFSHTAAIKLFPDQVSALQPKKSFFEIITTLRSESETSGVLPIENSISSNVHENIDYIFSKEFKIAGEVYLSIELALIGLSKTDLSEIKTIYSHPKAIEQCSKFIEARSFIVAETTSTSAAKEYVLEEGDRTCAFLGASDLAADPALTVLTRQVSNNPYNFTRFVAVQTFSPVDLEVGYNKLTVIFKIKHAPGSLAKVLTAIADLDINLTKLESKPIPGTDWEYDFWVDLEIGKGQLSKLLEVFKKETREHTVIGFYNKEVS